LSSSSLQNEGTENVGTDKNASAVASRQKGVKEKVDTED